MTAGSQGTSETGGVVETEQDSARHVQRAPVGVVRGAAWSTETVEAGREVLRCTPSRAAATAGAVPTSRRTASVRRRAWSRSASRSGASSISAEPGPRPPVGEQRSKRTCRHTPGHGTCHIHGERAAHVPAQRHGLRKQLVGGARHGLAVVLRRRPLVSDQVREEFLSTAGGAFHAQASRRHLIW